ncbi:unnamed protein product [Calypogeia fissa]
MEQTHVLPAVDGIPDRRCANLVLSWAGVRVRADVVVADPTRASIVSSAAHIPGRMASHAAQLKEEAYAIRHNGDLFYPFALEVFGALHWALDQFLRSSAAFCVERRPYPRSWWLQPFLGNGCRLHSRGLRPLRSSGGLRQLVLEHLGIFLFKIRP